MEEDVLFNTSHPDCNHQKQELYAQRRFDILNGFEFNLTRCLNCHKIVELEAKNSLNNSFSTCFLRKGRVLPVLVGLRLFAFAWMLTCRF